MTKYYYTIGEVSNLLEVKAHVLRYWESEIPALRPKKSGHQRRYSLQQIETLKDQRYAVQSALHHRFAKKAKQDKSLLEEAREEAIAKQKLQLSAPLPAIARIYRI